MEKNTYFDWDPESHSALCVIEDDKGRAFSGTATCHESDYDFESEKTGCEIAFRRAKIAMLQAVRDQDLLPGLRALNQLYYSMKHSNNFNPKSYENCMLQRQIRFYNFDLATIKEMLAYERKNLKEYIAGKDKFYNRMRSKRAEQDN